ncbi:MAG: hypothetical protein SNJ74_09255 [Fimbriimonadaceae bacterium]
MERLVFTVGRGSAKYAEMALGLGRSLSLVGDQTPRAVLTDVPGYDWGRVFHRPIVPPNPRSALDKMLALDLTDAERVLALDGDMLAFGKLDPIFEACAGMPFAVQGVWRSEGRWRGVEIAELCRRFGVDRIPKFNGGLVYYERTPETQRLIGRMREFEKNYGDLGFDLFRGNASEEICILLAMLDTGIGELIPEERDFMSTAVGIVGRLHMDVRRGECWHLAHRDRMRLVRPILFHASLFGNFRIYWRQLVWLRQLEKRADRTVPRKTGRWRRLQRSLERRTLWWYRRRLGP